MGAFNQKSLLIIILSLYRKIQAIQSFPEVQIHLFRTCLTKRLIFFEYQAFLQLFSDF